MAFRILGGLLEAFFFFLGLRWIFDAQGAAEGLGMPLDGMARSTQVGDLTGLFLCLGGFGLWAPINSPPPGSRLGLSPSGQPSVEPSPPSSPRLHDPVHRHRDHHRRPLLPRRGEGRRSPATSRSRAARSPTLPEYVDRRPQSGGALGSGPPNRSAGDPYSNPSSSNTSTAWRGSPTSRARRRRPSGAVVPLATPRQRARRL